jgi:galactonate dehydratase
MPPRSVSLISIATDGDVVGIGEAYAGYYVPELIPPIVDYYRPLLIGKDPFRIQAIFDELNRKSMRWGRIGLPISVLSGIECALWDLKGKALKVPVYQLLGGPAHDKLRIYASAGSSLWPMEKMVRRIHRFVGKGYTAIKTGTGYFAREPPRTLSALVDCEREKVGIIRKEFGNNIDLMIDHHAGFNRHQWSANTAIQVIQALDEYYLLWFEEPCAPGNVEEYAEVRKAVRTPISGGENATTLQEFRRFFLHQALDIAQPDAAWVGGIGECLKVVKAAEAHGVPVALHSAGSSVSLAANLHVAFACSNCFMLEYSVLDNRLKNALLMEPIEAHNGHISPPQSPGLGVQVTDTLRRKYSFVPGTGVADPKSNYP